MGVSISGLSPTDAPGFTYRGQHSGDLSVYLLRSPVPVFPELRSTVVARPGRHGSFDGPVYAAAGSLTLACAIRATSEQQLRERARAVAAWLDPTAGISDIELDAHPGLAWRGRISEQVAAEIRAQQGHFTATFILPTPFLYAAERVEQATLAHDGTHEIIVDATAPTPFVVEVEKAGTEDPGAFTLQFEAAGTEFGSIHYDDVLTGLLVVDTDDLTARHSDTNVLDKVTSDFPELPADTTVTVRYLSDDPPDENVDVTVRFRERHW